MPDGVPQIRITSLKGLPRLFRSLGRDPAALLRRFDLVPADTNRQGFFIDYTVYAEILEKAAELSGTPHLGLLLSRQSEHDLSVIGALAILFKHETTVGEALRAMIRTYSSHSQGSRYELETSARRAVMIREGLIPELAHNRVLQDLSLADFHELLSAICGEDFQCREVAFTCSEPEDLEPYHGHFNCDLKFDAPRQALVFDAGLLKRRIQAPDSTMESIMQGFASTKPGRSDGALRQSVLKVIETSLGTGHCSAAGVAAVFDMHPRTLHRQLSDEGTTFSELLVEKRREMAECYLRETPMPLQQVSEALGYSNPSIFTRAWRRWTGQSPSEWRDEVQHPEAI